MGKKTALLSLLVLALGLIACGGGDNGAKPEGTPGGPVHITLWHSEFAANGEAIEKLVGQFNASQTEVQVEVIFQGIDYFETLNKLVASLGSGEVPNLLLQAEQQTGFIADLGAAVPVQQFVDGDGYDLSDFDQKAVDYYTIEGRLYPMPFTISVPMIFYNKVAFREAGLDPDHAPATLEEVREASQTLLKRDDSGNVTRSGIVLEVNNWYVHQVHALQGEPVVDNDNGRDGRPSEALFDGPTGQRLFQWWDQMLEEGLAYNVGRNPSGIDNFTAVSSGRAAMTLTASSALRSVVNVLERGSEGKLELGTGIFPGFADGKGGPLMGGLALWVLDASDEEEAAAWKFVRWLLEPPQQAQWFSDTGYLPVRLSAYDLEPSQRVMEEYPHFRLPVEAYLAAPSTRATQGALLGPAAQVAEAIERAAEDMVLGGKDPVEAVKDAAAEADRIIAEYEGSLKR